jgi:hypothetical protein
VSDHELDLRSGLIQILRASRATEAEIFAAQPAATRDAPADDGGWSAKDIQGHLSAWRRHQTERMAAIREERAELPEEGETDAINAVLHAERADWPWDRVAADAAATSDALIDEVAKALSATLEEARISGSILGNGPEHVFAHLPPLAARVGLESRVLDLATKFVAILGNSNWPTRASAFARYNLACFYTQGGDLDDARALLRLALPEQEELRAFAPQDDDLIALRDEIPALIGG